MIKMLIPLFSLCAISMAAAEKVELSPAPAEPEGMVKIFNGKDLSDWDGDPRLWSAKDGVIRGQTTAENRANGNTFLIWKGGDVRDFELRLSARIDPGGIGKGNSGIQYRSKHVPAPKQNDWVVAGYQAELCNNPKTAGFLYHERGRAGLANVGQKVVIDEKGKKEVVGSVGDQNEIAKRWKMNDWNDYVIICKGNHVQQFLNGVQTIDLVDNDPKGRCMEGIIALQIHAGAPMTVEFRDIRLKKYE